MSSAQVLSSLRAVSSARAFRLSLAWVRVGLVAVVVCSPWLGVGAYAMRELILIAILSLVVSGLNAVLGYVGELAVAQVALYAVGAYTAGYLSVHLGVTDIVLCLLCAIAATMIVGILSGIPGLRLGGWSLAMVTFFLVLLIPDVLNLVPGETGATLGLAGIPSPTLFGSALSPDGFFVLVMVITAIWFALFRNMVDSIYGNALLVLKQSPILASAFGLSVYQTKLLLYTMSAVPVGVAGVLFAFESQYISSASFTFSLTISVLAASVVGGSQSVYGAIFGAALLQLGPLQLASFDQYSLVIYGALLIAVGLLFANGLAGWVRLAARKLGLADFTWPKTRIRALSPASSLASGDTVELPAMMGDTLEVSGLSKRFGGVQALDDVSLVARPGEVTALIGPNGSGKTTLLNLVCGYYSPDAGRVIVGKRDATGKAAHRVARLGVARTFQTPLMPAGMSTRAFVGTGRFHDREAGMAAAVLRLPSYRRDRQLVDDRVTETLALLGIGDISDVAADSLPLGTRRLVEVARILIGEPRLCLFDEVGSGLFGDDLRQLERVIRAMRAAGMAIVLVEHNFPLVLKLADHIHVLSKGRLIASGTPAEIQANRQVIEEYVGGTVGAT